MEKMTDAGHRAIHSPNGRLSLFFNDQGETLRFLETLPTGEEIDYFYRPEGNRNPMMHPWCNRVKGGAFSFGGEDFLLRPLHGQENNALHGNWQKSWRVDSQDSHSVTLVQKCLSHDGNNVDGEVTPYSYGVKQILELDDNSLNIEMVLTNHGKTLPFGIGLHPFFPRLDDTVLKVAVNAMENCGPDMIPQPGQPVITVPKNLALTHGLTLSNENLCPASYGFGGTDLMDNCFPGVDPTEGAIILWPSLGRQMHITASPNCTYAVCFVPGKENDVPPGNLSFFCFELATNGINMQNRKDAGAAILNQGEELRATTKFHIHKLEL